LSLARRSHRRAPPLHPGSRTLHRGARRLPPTVLSAVGGDVPPGRLPPSHLMLTSSFGWFIPQLRSPHRASTPIRLLFKVGPPPAGVGGTPTPPGWVPAGPPPPGLKKKPAPNEQAQRAVLRVFTRYISPIVPPFCKVAQAPRWGAAGSLTPHTRGGVTANCQRPNRTHISNTRFVQPWQVSIIGLTHTIIFWRKFPSLCMPLTPPPRGCGTTSTRLKQICGEWGIRDSEFFASLQLIRPFSKEPAQSLGQGFASPHASRLFLDLLHSPPLGIIENFINKQKKFGGLHLNRIRTKMAEDRHCLCSQNVQVNIPPPLRINQSRGTVEESAEYLYTDNENTSTKSPLIFALAGRLTC